MDTLKKSPTLEPSVPELDSQDLLELLALRPDQWLGRLINLNRSVRYHNSLNVILVAAKLKELTPAKGSSSL